MNWKNDFPKENRYFETDNGILYNIDCLQGFAIIPENSIDLIVTSPPYNVGIDYSDWNDSLPIDKYLNFVKDFLRGFKQVLKPDGRFAINIPIDINMKRGKKANRVSLLAEYYNLLKEVGLKYNAIVELYETSPQRVKYTAWGSYLSSSSPYIYSPKEALLIGYKEQWKKLNKGKSDMTKEEFMEIVKGIWSYRAETKGLTKANFSKDIPLKAVRGLTYVSDIVMDSFMGSGTTAVVCEKLNRKWIGFEISKEYCEIAKQRLLKREG